MRLYGSGIQYCQDEKLRIRAALYGRNHYHDQFANSQCRICDSQRGGILLVRFVRCVETTVQSRRSEIQTEFGVFDMQICSDEILVLPGSANTKGRVPGSSCTVGC